MSKSKLTKTMILFSVFLLSTIPLKFSIAQAQENTWTTLAPMPTSRYNFGLAVVDDKIFTIGGTGSDAKTTLTTNEMYNPKTNKWTTLTPMPTARSGFAIAVVQNQIHVIGGSTGATLSTSVHEVYDPNTDSWTTKEQTRFGHRSGMTANVVNGKIYIISGCFSPFRPWDNTNVNNVYDPETNTWTTKAPIPTSVYAYGSTTLDNKIYIFGGRSIFHNKTYDFTQIYDPLSNTWSEGTPVPMALSGSGVAPTKGEFAPKRIYFINGYKCTGDGGFSYLEDVYTTLVYDPNTDSWNSDAQTINRRGNVVAIEDIIYLIDGYEGEAYSGFAAKYTPIDYGNPNQTPTSTPEPESEFPTMPVLTSVVLVSIIGFGVLAYFKKRRS